MSPRTIRTKQSVFSQLPQSRDVINLLYILRWRSRPASQQNNGPHVEEKTKMQLTHPKTPQLMTKRRSRPNNVQGQSDIEDKIVEEMKG